MEQNRLQCPTRAGGLELRHAMEDARIVGEQLLGLAFLRDHAVREDDDLVGGLHGAHAVSDDQHGLARQQAGHQKWFHARGMLFPGLVFALIPAALVGWLVALVK